MNMQAVSMLLLFGSETANITPPGIYDWIDNLGNNIVDNLGDQIIFNNDTP